MTNSSTITAQTIKSLVNSSKYYKKFRSIHGVLIQISFPYIFVVVCMGLVTNTSTIVLLSKGFVTKNLRHKWTLIALALSDLIHNIALLIRVIHDIAGGKFHYLCISISFLSHLAELLSACFTVLFTVQRYAAVRYPLQAAFPERSSPIISLLSVFIWSFMFCMALPYFNMYVDCFEELKLSWFIADALFSFIIPFSLILVFNILIVHLIRKHARSPFIVQPTLSHSNRHVKSDVHCKSRKKNRFKDSISITGSYGVTLTSHGTLIETDVDRGLSPTLPSMHSNRSNASLIKQSRKSKSPRSISNELDFQAPESSYPMLPMIKTTSDCLSNNRSLSASSKSTRSASNVNKKKQRISLTINYPRRPSRLSADTDFISNKSSQTTQSIRVTRMLVLVSTCFLILNAPAHLCVIALKIYTGIGLKIHNEHMELVRFGQTKNLTSIELKNFVFIPAASNKMVENKHLVDYEMDTVDDQIIVHIFYIAILLTQLISYASYSINFFLYSFSGVAFRTSVRQIFNKFR